MHGILIWIFGTSLVGGIGAGFWAEHWGAGLLAAAVILALYRTN